MRAIIDSGYQDLRLRFIEAKLEPIGGWPWLDEQMRRDYPGQKMTIFFDGNPIFTLTKDDKPTKKAVKAVMETAQKAIMSNKEIGE